MKTWKIPIAYSMAGTVKIEANTLKEAINIALDDETELPDNAYYIDGSFGVDESEEFIRKYYNNNQKDDINE